MKDLCGSTYIPNWLLGELRGCVSLRYATQRASNTNCHIDHSHLLNGFVVKFESLGISLGWPNKAFLLHSFGFSCFISAFLFYYFLTCFIFLFTFFFLFILYFLSFFQSFLFVFSFLNMLADLFYFLKHIFRDLRKNSLSSKGIV